MTSHPDRIAAFGMRLAQCDEVAHLPLPIVGLVPATKRSEWHTLTASQAEDALATDLRSGLSRDEAAARLVANGPNALGVARDRSVAALVLTQLASPLIYLLFAAGALSLLLGHRSDAVMIGFVVVINAVIGAFQEGRAAQSLRALRTFSATNVRVVRDGHELMIPSRDLVLGDVLVVEAGDAVGADARIVESVQLQTGEAALTGESLPVAKHLDRVPADAVLGDRTNMIYAATQVTAGRGRAVVVATGAAAELGRIAALAEGTSGMKTPLELRIAQFGRYVIVAALATFVLIVVVGVLRGMPIGDVVMVGVSQLVGMIPEGLPVAMTIALAVGVQRMARRHAIVRQLGAVETLGSTTVICTDKTGTLTENRMHVTSLWIADGEGWHDIAAWRAGDAALGAIARTVSACNNAELDEDADRGDPTEIALLRAAELLGHDTARAAREAGRRHQFHFDAALKLMSTAIHETSSCSPNQR